MADDTLDIFDEILERTRQRLGIAGSAEATPGLPVPPEGGRGVATGPGTAANMARRTDVARRGVAPATLSGIGTALGNVAGIATNPIGTLVGTFAERAFPETFSQGSLGGLADIAGAQRLDPDLERAFINGDIGIDEAQRRQAERNFERAATIGGVAPGSVGVPVGLSGAPRSTFGKAGRFGFGGTAEGRTGPPGDLSRDPTPGKAGR